MKKIFLPLALTLSLSQAFAGPCAKPNENAASAFKTIETGGDLSAYLQKYTVTRTALNENCSDMYSVALIYRNEPARLYLEQIGYGPKMKEDYLKKYLPVALGYSSVPLIKVFLAKSGFGDKYDDSSFVSSVAETNTLDVVEWAIKQWGELDVALAAAVSSNSKSVIDALIRMGANANLDSVLVAAIERKDVSILKYLISAGLDVNLPIRGMYKSATRFAASVSTAEVMRLLFETGAKISQEDLFSSIFNDDLRVLETLIELGADPRQRDQFGTTLLMKATLANKPKVVKVLLKYGLSLEDENNEGMTALFFCKSPEMLKTLVEMGVKIHKLNKRGESALFIASRENNIELVNALIAQKVDPNVLDVDGNNMLLSFLNNRACFLDREIEVLSTLLSGGVNINQIDRKGYTALMKASMIRKCEGDGVSDKAISILLSHGPNSKIKAAHPSWNGKIRAYDLYLHYGGRNPEIIAALK